MLHKTKQKQITTLLTLFLLTSYTTIVSCTEIEKPLTKNSPWRPVQETVRDTVVQVFSIVAKYDWIEPYRTPDQHGERGSGFFINDSGDIITNAHVVDQAVAVWICIPSLGKRPLKAEIISICPERDIALLRLDEHSLTLVKSVLGEIPYLELGDSDTVHRSDEVLALGYPLGQEGLKSTTGVVSGRECHMIQMSAPINPGNSGGPLLNIDGYVIGINSSGVLGAQNVGYAIPINVLKMILDDLYSNQLLKKPYLGIVSIPGNEALTNYLGNPQPGGCFIADVQEDSPIAKAGVQANDMIYEIDGHRLDVYGEMSVPWCEDKISFVEYISRLHVGQKAQLLVYRNGEKLEITVAADISNPSPIKRYYPWYEQVDYEVFAGMVVMPLTINHIRVLSEHSPGLKLYSVPTHQNEPRLVITHIFPDSELARIKTIAPGSTLNEVNGQKVQTLQDFKNALQKSLETGFVTFRATDEATRMSDNVIAVLPLPDVCKEVVKLSQLYRYPLTETVQSLLEKIDS